MNAVQRLCAYRKSISTRPFRARGSSLIRCEGCGLAKEHCACDLKPTSPVQAAFCLIMYDTEPMKPSNTGRLIADVFPDDTHAFLWSRTEPNPELLALLQNPNYSPVVVFPESYVEGTSRAVLHSGQNLPKRPLYILLDGTWSEARKMFRKSPYLDGFPVMSIQPDAFSAYRMRIAKHQEHLCTAEVAGCLLQVQGDLRAAETLTQWFNLFQQRYMLVKTSHIPPVRD